MSCGITLRISTISGRPIRNYFYWEPHCFDIPICWSMRSLFDAIDGVDEITDKFDRSRRTTSIS